ncbi:MAG TPA: MFS transporter [Mesorhizobium sp.]|jgi:sugar phosphate permease|nr:MFS transporter [Mesorhizobium sp.]
MAGIGALAIAYVLSQFYRACLAVLTPALVSDLGASKADLSAASGAWFAAFALAQFGVGVSLDAYGPRRTAAILLALGGGGGAGLFALADTPTHVVLAMVLIGIGCSPVLMASFVIFAANFPPARFAVLASWMVAFGTLGNVVGAAPLAWAAESFGWRAVMVGLGGFTVAVALALLILLRDPARHEGPSGGKGFGGFIEILKMPVMWAILPMAAINYAPSAGIRALWAGPYLADVYGADTLAIGRVTLFMALAMVAGAFLYGPLDTLLKTRKWIIVVGTVVTLLALGFLWARPEPGIVASGAALVVLGIAGGGFGLLMAHGRAFVPAHLTGRGVTLMNFFSIGGVGLMQFASGAVVTSTIDGGAARAYSALFAFYALVLLLALAIYLFSRDAAPANA